MSKTSAPDKSSSRWPHRIAVLLAALVFPLIWIGGLVTTYDAGMAVPDWPNTYNYNMFAYPVRDWFFGPWDLFVEHGHRILGSIVGLVCIGLVVTTWLVERRRWVCWWSVLLLVLVIAQGVLGGQRVVQDERLLALVHGCFGPLFFATVVAMMVFTSRWWLESEAMTGRARETSVSAFRAVATVMLPVSYGQLVIGAGLRHIPVDADPTTFQTLILWHVVVAILIVCLGFAAGAVSCFRSMRAHRVAPVGCLLLGLVILQFTLGVTTYVIKFGWPDWFRGAEFAERFVVVEKSFWQMNLITAHVAVGSLILATATVATCRAARLNQVLQRKPNSPARLKTLPAT